MTMAKPKDPYTGTLNGALSVLIPVVAAPSTKKRNLVHFFVPAESTSVDFGAGAIPGIRMVTDNHVHLTAKTPLTTLSLGFAAGQGVSGPNGINFVTDGHKTESVKLNTWETYTGDAILKYLAKKTEDVTSEWTETGHDTKTETVHGLWTQTAQADRTETVIGKQKELYGTYDHVVLGEVTQTHMAARTETVAGPLTQTVLGPTSKTHLDVHSTFAYGAKAELFVGAQAMAVVGAQVTSNTGLQATVNTGGTVTVNAGLSATFNAPATATVNGVNVTYNFINISDTAFDSTNVGVDLNKVGFMIIV
jgi:hypothetical protein